MNLVWLNLWFDCVIPPFSFIWKYFRFNHSPVTLNQIRRWKEDRNAIIFMGIVIAFIICHFPRIFLDIHEIFTLEKSNFCQKSQRRNTVPSWVFIVGNISSLLLTLNANINPFIYGYMSNKFRVELKAILNKLYSQIIGCLYSIS